MTVIRLQLFLLIAAISASAQEIVKPAPTFPQDEQARIEKERTPNLEKLYELVRSADRIVVVTGSESQKKQLFESSRRNDLIAFQEALKLEIPERWKMSICPEPNILLFKEGKQIVSIGDVSGREVTTSVWSGNADIADSEKWLKWFDERGISVVRKEYEHAIAADKKDAEDRARWFAAMPRGILGEYEKLFDTYVIPMLMNFKPLLAVMEHEYPNRNDRVLALLHWFGSGSGPWNGTPDYEDIAERLLLSFSTKQILNSLDSKDLTPVQKEGAARLLSGWYFHRDRPNDLKLLSPKHKKLFYDHSMKSTARRIANGQKRLSVT